MLACGKALDALTHSKDVLNGEKADFQPYQNGKCGKHQCGTIH